jgi:hypothetical protein
MSKPFKTIFIESCVVGLLLIPFAYLAGLIAHKVVAKPSLPDVCSTWNENYIMEVNLFIAGFLFHMVLQYTGVNKYYVDQYYK